jgi:hypothetical protein
VSVPEHVDGEPGRAPASQAVAGYLAAAAIFGGLTALVYYPGRIGPASIVVALVAAGMGGSIKRFAALAMAIAILGFFGGMIVSVTLDRPIF